MHQQHTCTALYHSLAINSCCYIDHHTFIFAAQSHSNTPVLQQNQHKHCNHDSINNTTTQTQSHLYCSNNDVITLNITSNTTKSHLNYSTNNAITAKSHLHLHWLCTCSAASTTQTTTSHLYCSINNMITATSHTPML